jgi:alkanesulfonate monooxygenase SsuD/methylene tetrahydromethanopterin reductase-like flavin-dependent oxidoreductase (luciferase family)
MKVFVFDLVHYDKHLDHLAVDGDLPKLGRSAFEPQVAVKTYADHLDAWEEMDRLGYDGVAFNEHHATPYGLMNSPNLLAASAAQRTRRMKLLMYGNLLPLHDPLRLAEEIAMLDCLSNGRIICGVARGAAREYRIFGIPMEESRARFDECCEIMIGAWTQEVFSYKGRFNSYDEVSLWPRPVQQPHPPIWIPVTGSQESIEWAAERNFAITPGLGGPAREDIIRYYAAVQARHGRQVTPDNITIPIDCYVADSKADAIREYAPYAHYFQLLFNYEHVSREQMKGYFGKDAHNYLRAELKEQVVKGRDQAGHMSLEEIERQGESAAWGDADEVVDKIIAAVEHAGAGTVMVSFNRGAMPQEMYLNQIRRFAAEVMPRLQAHTVERVKFAEPAAAEQTGRETWDSRRAFTTWP